ncbi:hypothetical protein M9H77_36220 [Catharanthus roseus]|uniref:Uncharacterized protein n=1 Tax=Catharanthus roseus TaxID=4058 RepID=A0ACB9ZUX8_CATRO|nr:hypothetical protein M9H77_36220 [Catharanthus roseus]
MHISTSKEDSCDLMSDKNIEKKTIEIEEKDECKKEKEIDLEKSESTKENECYTEKQESKEEEKKEKEVVALDKSKVVSVFTNQTNSILVSNSSCVFLCGHKIVSRILYLSCEHNSDVCTISFGGGLFLLCLAMFQTLDLLELLFVLEKDKSFYYHLPFKDVELQDFHGLNCVLFGRNLVKQRCNMHHSSLDNPFLNFYSYTSFEFHRPFMEDLIALIYLGLKLLANKLDALVSHSCLVLECLNDHIHNITLFIDNINSNVARLSRFYEGTDSRTNPFKERGYYDHGYGKCLEVSNPRDGATRLVEMKALEAN